MHVGELLEIIAAIADQAYNELISTGNDGYLARELRRIGEFAAVASGATILLGETNGTLQDRMDGVHLEPDDRVLQD